MYLQVIATSGEGKEQRHAQKVYRLLQRGKHWVLVTLLLSNVIVNETLPIVLDRSLGGGWPAVLGSTVLIGMVHRQSFGIPTCANGQQSFSVKSFLNPSVFVMACQLAPTWHLVFSDSCGSSHQSHGRQRNSSTSSWERITERYTRNRD